MIYVKSIWFTSSLDINITQSFETIFELKRNVSSNRDNKWIFSKHKLKTDA